MSERTPAIAPQRFGVIFVQRLHTLNANCCQARRHESERTARLGAFGNASREVYQIHRGNFGFCHSGRHDGKPAIRIGETALFTAQECAQWAHGCRALSFIFIG